MKCKCSKHLQTELNGVGCFIDNELSYFLNHPFSKPEHVGGGHIIFNDAKTFCYSQKREKKVPVEANALLLALATAGLACLYYLTTCCSLAEADRLAWVGKSLCIISVYQRLWQSDSYHVEKMHRQALTL